MRVTFYHEQLGNFVNHVGFAPPESTNNLQEERK